jgi:septum formation protein
MPSQKLILASQSQTRIKLLKAAGLGFEAMSATSDEAASKLSQQNLAPAQLAEFLAQEKACSLSALYPAHYIIGADQTLNLNGQCFNKPRNMSDVYEHLKSLRGKTHKLHSAISIVKSNKIIFSHTETATLTMREFSDEFLATYIEQAGQDILYSVGCYHYEGLGIQLFEKVQGDYSTILGLPLLPLLAFLREIGITPT